MKKRNKIITLVTGLLLTTFLVIANAVNVSAVGQFSVSPMYQLVTLTPGEEYTSNFEIINPKDNTLPFYYTIEIEPFYVDNENNMVFEKNASYNEIIDWIEIQSVEGVIQPNETSEIRFTITVPENAAPGGQYVAINVKSAEYEVNNSTVDLRNVFTASHLVYADVSGESVRKGSIKDVKVPAFLFDGHISGSATIINEGNVHSQATHTLRIYPLFSDEEVFTNEEEPSKKWIMPGATSFASLEWKETPNIGIFHVIYNVEYEGVESTVDKYVIVCPLWLLFVIIFLIILLAIRIITGRKKQK